MQHAGRALRYATSQRAGHHSATAQPRRSTLSVGRNALHRFATSTLVAPSFAHRLCRVHHPGLFGSRRSAMQRQDARERATPRRTATCSFATSSQRSVSREFPEAPSKTFRSATPTADSSPGYATRSRAMLFKTFFCEHRMGSDQKTTTTNLVTLPTVATATYFMKSDEIKQTLIQFGGAQKRGNLTKSCRTRQMLNNKQFLQSMCVGITKIGSSQICPHIPTDPRPLLSQITRLRILQRHIPARTFSVQLCCRGPPSPRLELTSALIILIRNIPSSFLSNFLH